MNQAIMKLSPLADRLGTSKAVRCEFVLQSATREDMYPLNAKFLRDITKTTITTQYKLLRVLGITGTLSEVMN